MKKLLALLLIVTLPSSPCWAVPQLLNFQGKVRASEGAGHDSDRDDQRGLDITFRIFSDAAGGTALFSEAHTGQNSVAVRNGVFNVLIGALTQGGIPTSVFDGGDKYIELQVGQEVLPRQRVASVGYAFHSSNADFSLVSSSANYAAMAGGINSVTAVVSAATVTASSIVAASISVSGELSVGVGTIHLTNQTQANGVNNAITFTQAVGQGSPEIRTSAAGAANFNSLAPTGNLPLTINSGASGILSLNTLSSGDTLIAGGGGFVGVGTGTPATMLDVNGGTLVRSSSTWVGTPAPPLSLAGRGAMYFDSTINQFLISQNGGPYQPLLGATGATGPAGVTGPQGLQGLPGVTGIQGAAGATGVPGVTGPQGVQGSTGPIGPVGAQGAQGNMGLQGPSGTPGAPGIPGPAGAPGAPGAPGVANLVSPTTNFVAKITNTNPNQLGNSSIFDNGNVGIGTTSPAAALHVNGNVIAATPTASNHLATKGYVDAQISANSGALTNFVPYSTPGTFSFTVPNGVTKILVEAWGGGGGGSSGEGGGGGGGGGGGYGKGQFAVTPGSVLTITVGNGGVGGTSTPLNNSPSTYPTPGGNSQVAIGGTVILSASGGLSNGYFGPTGGAGGSAAAPLAFSGQGGANASGNSIAPTGGNGGGSYGNSGGGFGCTQTQTSNNALCPGANGADPGAGGGGGATQVSPGGNGGRGTVIIWY